MRGEKYVHHISSILPISLNYSVACIDTKARVLKLKEISCFFALIYFVIIHKSFANLFSEK